MRLKTPRSNREHSFPPTFPLPFPFNHCEALIWSHELHTRCVDFIANISGPQLGPKTMLMESVAFQYSEILKFMKLLKLLKLLKILTLRYQQVAIVQKLKGK